MTIEEKHKIYVLMTDLLKEKGIDHATKSMRKNLDILTENFQEMYQVLQKENLIPEGMNYTIFQNFLVQILELEIQRIQVTRMFGR